MLRLIHSMEGAGEQLLNASPPPKVLRWIRHRLARSPPTSRRSSGNVTLFCSVPPNPPRQTFSDAEQNHPTCHAVSVPSALHPFLVGQSRLPRLRGLIPRHVAPAQVHMGLRLACVCAAFVCVAKSPWQFACGPRRCLGQRKRCTRERGLSASPSLMRPLQRCVCPDRHRRRAP